VVDSRHRRALPIGRDGRVIELELGNPVEGDPGTPANNGGGRLMARWEEASKHARKIGEQAWPDQTRFEPRIRHQYKSAWPHHLGSKLDPSVKQQASAKTDDASYRLFLPCCRWSAMEPTNKVFVRCWGGSIYCTYVAMTSKVPRCISDKKAITISKQCSACITVFGRTGPKKRCIYMETIRGFGSCVNLIISPRIVSLGLQP
jgi:hypothetical protein